MSEHTQGQAGQGQHPHGGVHNPNNGQHSPDHAGHALEEEARKLAESAKKAPPITIEKEFKFSFKKKTVDDLGMETKRAPVILTVPIPTYDGLINELIEDKTGKVAPFVLELVEEAIKDQIRTQLTDEEKPVNRQEDLDLSKLTLSWIANLPKGERGGGITKDTWTEWEKDYIDTMVPLRANDPKATEKVTKAAKLFTARLNPCRTDKPVLKFLREQLSQWASNTSNADEYAEVFSYLDNKATELMNRDNTSQLANLA